jgi:hypothetical protein
MCTQQKNYFGEEDLRDVQGMNPSSFFFFRFELSLGIENKYEKT